MAWNTPIERTVPPKEGDWNSNEMIWQHWMAFVKKRPAENTRRNLQTYTRIFFLFFEEHVTTLTRYDMERFVERIESKCTMYLFTDPGRCNIKMPLDACPMVASEATDGCERYTAMQPSGVWSYITAINRFYAWLVREGQVQGNPMTPVMQDYRARNHSWFKDRADKPHRRVLVTDDVRLLVTESPLHHGILYMLMAKCFLRLHEVLKLSVDPEYFNLEEGWADLPIDSAYGCKRDGNRRIIFDAEAKRWLRRYWVWREDHIKRDAIGDPVTDKLIITSFGTAWPPAQQGNVNMMLHNDATRLGLMTGSETTRRERVNSHCFRAFATTYAEETNVGPLDLLVLRGDKTPGSIDRYSNRLPRLPRLYRDHAPVLGI